MDLATQVQIDRDRARARLAKAKGNSADPRQLEARGYRAWYAEIFGQDFVDVWEDHHEEAIRWHWETRHKLFRGEPIDYNAYLAIWSRGHMKSTIARRVAICDAALSCSHSQPGYCLYLGGSNAKANSHALSVQKLLERPSVARYYPKITEIMKTSRGHSQGDARYFKYLASGYVVHFASLDAGIAGGNVDDTRPTLIIPDDVDERGASAEVYTNRAFRFTAEVLPMRQANTLVFGAQNLIQRNTIFNQIHTNKIPALANRFPTKAIPAVYDLVTERVVVDGVARDIVKSGRSSWKAWDLPRVQAEIDDATLEVFLMEHQHQVDARKTGLVLSRFHPQANVITWSEFEAVYGKQQRPRTVPRHWAKGVGHDWGNIHPNVTSLVAVSAQNSKLPGLKFLYGGLSMPQQSTVDDVALAFIERFLPQVDTRPVRSVSGDDYAKWINGRMGDVLNAPREIAKAKLLPAVRKALRSEQFVLWACSHEQLKNREVYNTAYGLPYLACNPGASGGISEMNAGFTVDWTKPHPFRPNEMGYAGFYLIVDDDQFEEARDDFGLALWREQFALWAWRESRVTMQGLNDDLPAKVFDDTGNSLMMLFSQIQKIKPALLTIDEEVEHGLPEAWQTAAIAALPVQQRDSVYAARLEEYEEARARITARRRPSLDYSDLLDEGGAGDID